MLQRSVPDHIVSALKQASFNGTVENEHGKDVLKRLMDNGKRVYYIYCLKILTFS